VLVDGGAPLRISDAPAVWSAVWGADQHIIFAAAVAPNGLRRVPADGGAAEELTMPKAEQGELQHAFPQLLPGGERVLFSVLTKGGWEPAVLSLRTREWTVLRRGSPGYSPAHFAASGHLVYAQANGGLVAVPFDPSRGELSGSAIPLLERIDMIRGASAFALSQSGTLVYLPARTELPRRALVLVDREGRSEAIPAQRGPYTHPRVSRDGQRLAVALESETGADIWVVDVQRGTRQRLTGGGFNGFPLWSPDGSEVTFQAAASPGRYSLFARNINNTGDTQPLLGDQPMGTSGALAAGMASLLPGTMPRPGSANPHVPMSWTGDGRYLAFDERKPGAQRDVWILTRGGDPAPFVLTAFDEWSPAFSPDGQWLAYVSNESGRNEVYVQPYPGPGGKWPISTDGGTEPAWSPDGKELFYRRDDQLLAVPVQTRPDFSSGTPKALFEGPYEIVEGARNYDPMPDGRRFVMIRSDGAHVPQRFYVVSRWFDELNTRSATQ
jgi:serine/threonine-protein kinase